MKEVGCLLLRSEENSMPCSMFGGMTSPKEGGASQPLPPQVPAKPVTAPPAAAQ